MAEQTNPDLPARGLDRPIFEARGRTWTLGRILGAAELLGLDGGLWQSAADATSCATYAEEEGFEIEDARLQEALDDFRYGRQLVTAEETEAWLLERDVTEDDLIEWLERRHWLERFAAELPSIRADYPPPADEVEESLWPEIILGARLRPLATSVARRLVSPEPGRRERDEAARAPARALRHELPREWVEELLALEASYQGVCREALSSRRIAETIGSRRLELTRVDLEAARFASLGPAREAFLCVTQDREDFGATVERAGARREDRQLYLGDAPESLGPSLISASPGEVFLVEEGEEPLLVRVRSRKAPSADDPAVLERVQGGLLDRVFTPLVEAGVRFLFPLE